MSKHNAKRKIPYQNISKARNSIPPPDLNNSDVDNKKIVFSFLSLDRNQYFNLDGTCENWSSDLFKILKEVSNLTLNEVFSGEYSGRNTTLRIHQHENANKPPVPLPNNIKLKEMWQIRISKSKGGVHGTFSDNIFYIIWLDPQHNMYPDAKHGGLRKIIPPSTCCKERDNEITRLEERNNTLTQENQELKKLFDEYTQP